MNISKDNPDYVFEEYKGYTIASSKGNVAERNLDNFIIVFKAEDFPAHGFVIGLDDSKRSGGRKLVPVNIEDAKSYIDWAIKCREEKTVTKPEHPEQQNRRGRKM